MFITDTIMTAEVAIPGYSPRSAKGMIYFRVDSNVFKDVAECVRFVGVAIGYR